MAAKMGFGLRKTVATLATLAAVFALYFAVERPWFLSWGATNSERNAVLPGDELVPGAPLSSTRAVTIDAPIKRVWPWLAQLGQDRGGFYSYEVLEDLVGCEMPRATRILPEHQSWKPGDKLWMYPSRKIDGQGSAALARFEPGLALVFVTRQFDTPRTEPEDGSWGMYLDPAGTGSTRFIARGRSAGGMGALATAFNYGFFEPAHYVMERRMMLNMKALAEGGTTSRLREDAEVAMWFLAVLVMIASLVAVARREHWQRPLAVAVSSALAFQLLTLAQPPPLVGVGLVAALAYTLWWPGPVRPRARRAIRTSPVAAHAT